MQVRENMFSAYAPAQRTQRHKWLRYKPYQGPPSLYKDLPPPSLRPQRPAPKMPDVYVGVVGPPIPSAIVQANRDVKWLDNGLIQQERKAYYLFLNRNLLWYVLRELQLFFERQHSLRHSILMLLKVYNSFDASIKRI